MKNSHLHVLLDLTLKEMQKSYKPGTISRIKGQHKEVWAKLISLEAKINHAVLAGEQKVMERALNQYRKLIKSVG